MSARTTEETRAHYQRTEGMVIFDTEVRSILPDIIASMTDEFIEERLVEKHLWVNRLTTQRDLTLSHDIGELLVTGKSTSTYNWLTKHGRVEPMSTGPGFTHKGISYGMFEGLQTAVHFPLNLMAYADSAYRRQGKAAIWTTGFASITRTMRQPWFHQVCNEDSAFAVNGTWKAFSLEHASDDYGTLMIDGKHPLGLAFYTANNEPAFRFDRPTIQKLHEVIRQRNQAARDPNNRSFEDSDVKGTSSGCPLRHLRPQFMSGGDDHYRLRALAEHYQVSAATLTVPRPETGISFSLNAIAGFLDRVHAIDQSLLAK